MTAPCLDALVSAELIQALTTLSIGHSLMNGFAQLQRVRKLCFSSSSVLELSLTGVLVFLDARSQI